MQALVQGARQDADAAAEARAGVEGRHEEAARHAGAEGEDHLDVAHESRRQQRPEQVCREPRLRAVAEVLTNEIGTPNPN